MKQNLKFFVGLAAIVAGLAACDNQALDPVVSNPDQIAFRIGGPAFEAAAGTKAFDAITVSNLESAGFDVLALTATGTGNWDAAAHFVKVGEGATAKYVSSKYWPAADPGYRFYAVYPSETAMTPVADDGGATITANASSDVLAAKLVPEAPATLYKQVSTLAFEHIFACLNTVEVKALDGYTISDFTISITPVTSATYNIKTGWGDAATAARNFTPTSESNVVIYALGSGNAFPETADEHGEKTSSSNPGMLLVPGTYQLSATWTATHGGVTRTYEDKRVAVVLQPGKLNIVKARLGAQIMFDVTVTAWDANTIDGGLTFPVS